MEETGASYEEKYGYSHKTGQNVWNKVRKLSKIGQEDMKNMIFAFVSFLTTIAKVLLKEGRLDTRLSLLKFDIFLTF